MKKIILITLALAIPFCLGFAFQSIITNNPIGDTKMKRVTGIGGIFFKCQDPQKVREWYQTHLGLETNQYGSVFEWRQADDSTKKGFSQWSPFKETTKYFEPSTKEFMINYRVENLEALVEELKKEGVTVTDTIETVDYGKFVHIMDIEGNKIELWEPNDIEFEKLGIQMGAKTTK
ncbi:MAG TPA: VOC family protein [candidate division Zixibacteria bacterium]|nr:VOC family protein [candidate division Zixibacteria bacterium]